MYDNTYLILATGSTFWYGARAETAISPKCAPGSSVTTVPACNYFLNATDSCGKIEDRASRQGCICNQGVLDSIFK
jgi:hypothetical protein